MILLHSLVLHMSPLSRSDSLLDRRSSPAERFGRAGACRALAVAAVLAAVCLSGDVGDAAAQELPLKREVELELAFECAPVPQAGQPTVDARAEAARLAAEASEATILGDRDRARGLLAEASRLDPQSVDLAYRYARTLEETERLEDALAEYCRALALAPDGLNAPDARRRIEALADRTQAALPQAAVRNFTNAVNLAELGQLETALANLDRAIAEVPEWADPHYNRGVVLLRMGRTAEAEAALSRYLELAPDAPDVIAVSQRIGAIQARGSVATANPAAALGVGLIPGIGQVYTGRPVLGLGFLTLAGASAATSALHERSDGETFLLPGASIAATAAVVGAFDAYFHARRQRMGPAFQPDPSTALLLGLIPGLGHAYTGRTGTGLTFMTVSAGLVLLSDIAEHGTSRQVVEAALVPAAGLSLLGALDASLHAWRGQTDEPPNPWAALGLGIAPGLGQFYTGRTGMGFAVASLALTSVALTFTYEESSGRGFYPNGLYVAGGITALGAIEAFFGARRAARRQATGSEGGFALGNGAATLHGPALVGAGPRGVSMRLARLTF